MKTILVIEDEKHTRENLCTILDMEGYASRCAVDGVAGVAAALKEKPDLILCDVSMPRLDGLGVLAALRRDERTASIPFIFLTAKGTRPDMRTGMDLGADDYLTKPASAAEVLAAIEARFTRTCQHRTFAPNFEDPKPLEALGLTPREAEVLLWLAQGKSNGDIGTILGAAENTIKVHVGRILEKLGADNRHAAGLTALERLSRRRHF